MAAAIAVHVAPFYFNGWLYGAATLVASYIVAGILSGLYVGSHVRSENWPENFIFQIRYGPVLLYFTSVALIILLTWNKLK
jgi:hypothetical protein